MSQMRSASTARSPARPAERDQSIGPGSALQAVPDTEPVAWRAKLPGLSLLALRIISALVLFEHATARAFGFPINPARAFTGAPEMFTRPWFATVLELFGGLLIMLGLFTRPVAFVLSGLMAFAYFIAHAPENFFPIINRGEPAVLLCFIFLYLSANGAGPYGLDTMLGRRRENAPASHR
jgi:putative oxidoreductase